MAVSVKTVQRLEKAATVKHRDAAAYRGAIMAHSRPSERGDIDRAGEVSGAPRRPLGEALRGLRALEWLVRFRRELGARGVVGEMQDRAVDLVTNEGTLGFLVGGLAADGQGFTEDEALEAMESAAVVVRNRLAQIGVGK